MDKELIKKKLINSKILQKITFALLIFVIPSNLFKTFQESTAYINGLRIDYLIPKLNLSDLIITIFLLSSVCFSKKNRTLLKNIWIKLPNKNIWLPLLGLLSIFQLTTNHFLVALLTLIRLTILIINGIIIFNNQKILTSTITITAIKITLLFQSLLAWFQYLQQKSFLSYYFFGETNLNSYAGITKSNLFGIQKILPYGTTAHPNILGGILAVFSLIQLNETMKNKKYQRTNLFLFLFGVSTVVLIQSLSAILALTVGVTTILLRKKINLSLAKVAQLFVATNIVVITFFALTTTGKFSQITSVNRRAYLNNAAINMLADHIFTGVGLLNFTSQVEKFSNNHEIVRFVQPAHNVLLLFLAETGLLGITIVITLLIPNLRNKNRMIHPEYLLAIIPILTLDHYLITIQSGLLLLFFTLINSIKSENN